MPITALYAALLAALFLLLSARTIARRGAAQVEIGTATRDVHSSRLRPLPVAPQHAVARQRHGVDADDDWPIGGAVLVAVSAARVAV